MNNIAINIRPDDNGSLLFLKELIVFLEESNKRPMLKNYAILQNPSFESYIVSDETFVQEGELGVAIGGDGTFLRTTKIFCDTDIPIFGINRGHLGFLTEFSPEEAIFNLTRVFNGDYKVSRRSLMETALYRDEQELERKVFLNDSVISKGSFSRAIHLRININNEFFTYLSGDGLLVATPTGSTAYSLSAGGPIISPRIEDVCIVTPICPHTLSIRPIILPAHYELKVEVISESANILLTIDGQDGINLQKGDLAVFRSTDKKVSLITHPTRSYYDILRQKLGWGETKRIE